MKTEVAVIGGGPAGLSAAIEAAEYGVEVALIDENKKAGGQLFKQIHKFFGSGEHRAGVRGIDIGNELLEKSNKLGINLFLDTIVWGIFEDHKIGISTKNKSDLIEAKKIIIATGAYENTITFHGWTLPGVVGAGAAQTIMNVYRVKPGNRVLMVGSGNVGLIITYQMLQAGIEVVGMVEFLPEIGGYLVHAAKIIREGVPIYTSSTILRAEGNESVEEAVIARVDDDGTSISDSAEVLDVDTICIAVGLRPRTKLSEMIGCKMKYLPDLGGFVPQHDKNMETSVKDFYIAGDLSGVEEASTALEEGKLAGISVAESLNYIKEDEAIKKKNEILNRLNDLRLGPFGRMRKDAKKELMKDVN